MACELDENHAQGCTVLGWLLTLSQKACSLKETLHPRAGPVPYEAKLKKTEGRFLSLQHTGMSQMPELSPQAPELTWSNFHSVEATKSPLFYFLWFLGTLEQSSSNINQLGSLLNCKV